jgi:ribosome-associated protein
LTATQNEKEPQADASEAKQSEQIQQLRDQLLGSLDDLKAIDVRSINVSKFSDVTDWMVLASGTSNRHVRALVNRVVEDLKETDTRPLGVEGRESSEWELVDYGDVVLHVMQAETRRFYDLERLWADLPAESTK